MTEQSPDLFGFTPKQGDLFANEPGPTPGIASADPAKVRLRLHRMLAEARAAESVSPWDDRTTRLHQRIFPQMAKWLPDDEAKQLWIEFRSELERLCVPACEPIEA